MNKKRRIIVWVLIILLGFILLLVWGSKSVDNNIHNIDQPEKESSELVPKLTETPTLEEIAEESLETIEDLTPEPSTEVLPLEEQAEKEGKDISEFIPKPSNVEPLEE